MVNNAKKIPDKSGVYEVKCVDKEIRLHIGCSGIGKDQKLLGRMKKMLGVVKGDHSAGKEIRNKFNDKSLCPCDLIVRWAITENGDIAEVVEKMLMIRHFQKFKSRPICDKRM